MRPKVNVQGRFEVRKSNDDELFITYPDGSIGLAVDPPDAYRTIQKWSKKHMKKDSFNVALIDWYDGLTPPKES